MILFIDITELEEEFSSCPISLNYVRNVGIDYWTNTIDGIYCEPYSKDERDCCLFRFEKFFNSNKKTPNKISHKYCF